MLKGKKTSCIGGSSSKFTIDELKKHITSNGGDFKRKNNERPKRKRSRKEFENQQNEQNEDEQEHDDQSSPKQKRRKGSTKRMLYYT